MSFFKPLQNLSEKAENKSISENMEHVKCLIIGSGPAGGTDCLRIPRGTTRPQKRLLPYKGWVTVPTDAV